MRRFLLACGLALTVMAAVTTSADAACLASTREVKLPDGSVTMKAYSCSLTDGGEPVLQVEFNRLSEAIGGSLIEASPDVDFQRTYGSWRILNNKIYRAAKELFDDFGTRQVEQGCFYFQLSSALPGQSYSHKSGDACKDRRVLWYFSYPENGGDGLITFANSWQAQLVDHALPSRWQVSYPYCDQVSLDCVRLWRMVDASDLKRFAKDAENFSGGLARYAQLVEHITEGRVPNDFLVLVRFFNCGDVGCEPVSGVYVRRLLLHAAFVKNISNQDLAIDGLIQADDESEALRPYVDGQSPRSAQKDPIAPVILSPGQTLIIPLRLNFLPSVGSFGDLGTAMKNYQKIRSSNGEFVSCPDTKVSVRRESLPPPAAPPAGIYSYGPAATLKGVSISGTPIAFDRPLANFIEIAASAGFGSCPYVYAYDAEDNEWVRHGKIIDNASAPEKETTERLELAGLVTRFRISEEELELTFVRNVRLELALADGRTVKLMPRNWLRLEGGDHYDKIKYGAEREYDFDLPDEVDRASVVKSTLAVTGYYLRYSDAASIAGESGR